MFMLKNISQPSVDRIFWPQKPQQEWKEREQKKVYTVYTNSIHKNSIQFNSIQSINNIFKIHILSRFFFIRYIKHLSLVFFTDFVIHIHSAVFNLNFLFSLGFLFSRVLLSNTSTYSYVMLLLGCCIIQE